MKYPVYKHRRCLALCAVICLMLTTGTSCVSRPVARPAGQTVSADTTGTPVTSVTEPPESISSDTEPVTPSFPEDAMQAVLDAHAVQIDKWIEENRPLYGTVDTTDPESAEITEFLPEIAFYYRDLETGLSCAREGERVFFAASVIKEPYVLHILEAAEAESDGGAPEEGSLFDFEDVFVYEEDTFAEGSGVIQNEEFGTTYTYYDLLQLAITKSDNVAFKALRNRYGRSAFRTFSHEVGVTHTDKSLYAVSASDMGAYLTETYRYMTSGGHYAEDLKHWMLTTNHRVLIPSALKPIPVCNKYGWDTAAYHDAALVWDEHPYVLVILTELDEGSAADNTFIRGLAGQIHAMHREMYENAEKECAK